MRQKYVPLPEVSEHTDAITIGELGMPVGFDLERLELNVPRVEAIVSMANSDHVTVTGYRGDTTQVSYGFNGYAGDGVASASAAKTASKAKIQSSSVERGDEPEYLPRRYLTHKLDVKINNAEIEERIKDDGDKWELGVWDAQARAKYMNAAIQRGLSDAALTAVVGENPHDTLVGSVIKKSIMVTAVSLILGVSYKHGLYIDTAAETAFPVALQPVRKWLLNRAGKEDLPLHFSMAARITYDRLALAALTAHSSKLIRSN